MNESDIAQARKKWPVAERGRTVAKLRSSLGISQENLAAMAKLSRAWVSAFEQGSREPSVPAETRIMNVLLSEQAARRLSSEGVPVYGEPAGPGVTLRDIFAGAMPAYSSQYGEAVKIVAELETRRPELSATEFAIAKLAVVEQILKLASDAPDAAKLAGLAKELVTEGRKTLSDRPSAEHPSRIVLE